MEYPSFQDDMSIPNNTLNYQLLFNITLQNLYSRNGFNISDSRNLTQADVELHSKLKVLLHNYFRQLYLKQQETQLYDVPWALIIVLSLLYGAISVTSLVGNGLVIWVVLGSRKMRTVTNLFICNLAAADLFIGLLVVPFHFQAALLQRWHLPHFLCALCPFFQVLGVNLNVFTLCTIAVDRYRAVMNPLSVKTTKRKALALIALIWLLSLSLAFPTYLDYKVVYRSTSIFVRPRAFCHSVVYSPETRMFYNMGLFAVQYAIPVIIISFAYVRMGLHLWGRIIPGNQEKGRDAVLLKNKKQAIKTLALFVLLFGICWLPFQVYSFLQYVIPAINYYKYINIIWFCMHWLAMSNSCLNPFVYAVHNESFQQQFRSRVNCCGKQICLIRKRIPQRANSSQPNHILNGVKLHSVRNVRLEVPGPSVENSRSQSQEVDTKSSVGFTEKRSSTGNFKERKEKEAVVTTSESGTLTHTTAQITTNLETVLKDKDFNML